MIKKAVFPFSADPITKGHIDLIKRALKITSKLYILVLNNLTKEHAFNLEERRELVSNSLIFLKNQKNFEVNISEKTLVNFCLKNQIFYVIRGIRTPLDIQNEIDFKSVYIKENRKLEFIYLLANLEYREISSSLAKAMFKRKFKIKDYVTLPVKQALEIKTEGQYKIIVTGIIGSGKNYICKKLMEYFHAKGCLAYEIDFDKIVDEIYEHINKKKFYPIKKKLCSYFKINLLTNLTKEIIIKKVFSNHTKENLTFLQENLSLTINSLYQEKLENKQGLILLNAPLAAEYKMLDEANNTILFVDVSEENQKKYLLERDKISPELLKKKILAAQSSQAKLSLIKEQIKKDQYGKIFLFKNNYPLKEKKEKRIAQLGEKIIQYFKIKQ